MIQRLIVALLALLASACVAVPASAQDVNICFPETGQCVSGRFGDYWAQNGGLPVFGYPIAAPADEYNNDLGQNFTTQWFERERLELHPQNPRPYDVLLGRLGAEQLQGKGINWQSEPKGQQQNGCLWFAQTQHSVCDQVPGQGFRSYWVEHGLEFDGRVGKTYEESLALFGLPLTEPRIETNSSGDQVLTQWFERARFEWHPNNTDQYKVLLGLLGNESRARLNRGQNPGVPGRLVVQSDRLYEVEADGTQITPLQFGLDPSSAWAVTRDYRRAASRCTANGATGVCVSDLDGRNQVRINSDPNISHLAWSPDGSRIAYVSGSDDRRGLHVINTNGSGDVLLMAGTPDLMQANPSWSPDSRQLTFNTVFSETAIYVVNADGSNLRRIGQQGERPDWSPTSSRIVYQANEDIHTINADGSQHTQITSGGDTEFGPTWSPDGSRIAYRWAMEVAPNPRGGPSGVYVVRADGSNPVRVLYTEPTFTFLVPTWSPDSQYVAAGRACPRLCGPQQIWGAKADGSQPQFLMVEGGDLSTAATLIDWLP